jgi:23S rRNA (cytidine1920-2'-O)/16S rRNA (cytidine1409-2'-O)-methyltransferase
MKSESNPISKSKKKQRLDQILVERGLVETREKARRLIMAGEVLVDEQVSDKPGRPIAGDAVIRVRALPPYVSRGGLKLAAALEAFHVDVSGLRVIDVGASTGGFSDCLLQHGAERIFAVDVGYGQLAWKLRSDQRVVVLERTNIRYLSELPGGEVADMAVIDASFISLALVLPPTLALLSPIANLIALIKPQFEAGKGQVGKGGVVRDEQIHRRVLNRISELALSLNLELAGLIASPLLGPAGNVEFLVWLSRNPDLATDGADAIDQALSQARTLRAAKKS